MQKSNTIINELKEISEVVADLAGDQPFTIPEGYFEQLPEKIVALVKAQPAEETNFLNKGGKVSAPFSPPAGYFDQLASNIINKVIADVVPGSGEPDIVSPVISKVNKQLPFTVPQGYFEELASNAMAGIKAIDFVESELEIVSPELNGLKRRPVFSVPDGYFEQFPKELLRKIKSRGRMLSGNFSSQVFRFAAAALVTGIIATGILLFNQEKETVVANAAASTNASLDSSINHISDAEISDYVQNNEITLAEPSNAIATDLQQEDMKDMLAEVSDKDIESYLTQYGILNERVTN